MTTPKLDNTRKGKTRRILLEVESGSPAFLKWGLKPTAKYTPNRDTYLVVLGLYDQYCEHVSRLDLEDDHLPKSQRRGHSKTFPGFDFDRLIRDTRPWMTRPDNPLVPERVAAAVLYLVGGGVFSKRTGRGQTDHRSWVFEPLGIKLCENLTGSVREFLLHSEIRRTPGKKDGNNKYWAPLVLVGRLLDGRPRNRCEISAETGLHPGQIKPAERLLKEGFTVVNAKGETAKLQGGLIYASTNPDKLVLSAGVLLFGDADLDGIGDDATDKDLKGIETVVNKVIATGAKVADVPPEPETEPEIDTLLDPEDDAVSPSIKAFGKELGKVGGDPVVPPHPGPKRPCFDDGPIDYHGTGPMIPPVPGSGPCTDPDKMHGAADGFPGTDDAGGGMWSPSADKLRSQVEADKLRVGGGGNGSGLDPNDLNRFLDDVADGPEPFKPKAVSRIPAIGCGYVEVIISVPEETFTRVSRYLREDGLGTIEEAVEESFSKLVDEAEQFDRDAKAKARLAAIAKEQAVLAAEAVALKSQVR